MRLQDALKIKMQKSIVLALALLTCVTLYILVAVVRRPTTAVKSSESFADPTRTLMRDGGRRRVSDTERTKLLNSGGRKGYV